MRCPRRDDNIWGREAQLAEAAKTDPGDYYREDGTCSYCGGPSGTEIMKRIESGEEVEPTDKSYKIYISGHKAYFQHLSWEQQLRFIDLYNDHKMNVGFPHFFYTMPFFCSRKKDG